MSLFDLLSVLYAVLGVRALATVIRNRSAFTDADLTAADRRMASEIAFFVFVPLGVLLHELGHAAATYQVGGTLNWFGGGFHYALFYGYVIPEGHFTPLQDWWIALSGNLVSVLYGFLPLLFIPLTQKAWVRYTILAFARIQLGWSLVGYPLITLTGIDSDWATIYSTRTLMAGAPLFVLHAGLVAGLLWLDRSARVKRWEVGLYAGAAETLRPLDAAVAARPGVVEPLVARGRFFAAQGQSDLAKADYGAALKLDPQNALARYHLGQWLLNVKRYTAAEKEFRAALVRGAGDASLADAVHYALGLCLYHRGASAGAVAEFDAAITARPDAPELYFWRGLAHRAGRDETQARSDFTRAAELAAASNPALAHQALELAGAG